MLPIKNGVVFRETVQCGKGFCKTVCLKKIGLELPSAKSFENERL